MGGARSWAKEHQRQRQREGKTEAAQASPSSTLQAFFRNEGDRSVRLRLYLERSPSGKRDVEPILNRLKAERKGREEWLRAVLNADND